MDTDMDRCNFLIGRNQKWKLHTLRRPLEKEAQASFVYRDWLLIQVASPRTAHHKGDLAQVKFKGNSRCHAR